MKEKENEIMEKLREMLNEWEALHPQTELVVLSLPKNDPAGRWRMLCVFCRSRRGDRQERKLMEIYRTGRMRISARFFLRNVRKCGNKFVVFSEIVLDKWGKRWYHNRACVGDTMRALR